MISDKDNVDDFSKAPSSSLRGTKQGGSLATVDLNCDMGEGLSTDASIMPFISSANIACGYHAGDEKTIWQTIELAVKHQVAIGAHVSFYDIKNFGRVEMDLSPDDIYELVEQQLIIFKEIADLFETRINHVKPHGALYNMSAKDAAIAKAIARSVKDFDHSLILFGLSGSHSILEANAIGLKTASEVFADRSYQDDGSLTPRSQPNALIEDRDIAARQAVQMVKENTVTSISGKIIPVDTATICIHGDGKHAVDFAKTIADTLKQQGIKISAPS